MQYAIQSLIRKVTSQRDGGGGVTWTTVTSEALLSSLVGAYVLTLTTGEVRKNSTPVLIDNPRSML